MARIWPLPADPGKTIHVFGDLHFAQFGASTIAQETTRRGKLLADLSSPMVPGAVAHRVFIGDEIENWGRGDGVDDANAQAWIATLPGAATYDAIVGNHDLVWNASNFRTALDWASHWGYAAQNWVRDLGFVRLIAVGPDTVPNLTDPPIVLSQATLDWLDTQLTEAGSQDCWVLCHAPLYNTVLGDPAGTSTNNSTQDFFRVHALDIATDDTAIRTILANHDNAQAWISGHTHSPLTATGIITTLTLGGHAVASINCASPWYQWTIPDIANRWNDPIITFYLTKIAGGIEVRIRNHGAGCWVGLPGGGHVITITL